MGFMGGSKEFAMGLHYVLVPISTLAVILRSYTRIFVVKSFGLDDKLAVCSCLGNLLLSGLILWLLSHGGGRPTDILTSEDFEKVLKVSYGIFPVRQFTVCCLQLSYLAFYNRFLVDRSQRILYFIGGYATLQNLLFTLLIMFRCNPIHEAWNPASVGEGCLPLIKILLGLSAGSIVVDFSIYIIPLPSVFTLRVPLRRRLGLLVLFTLGFAVLGASCWHFSALVRLNFNGRGAEAYSTINAATIEFNLAIIIACAPGMKPLFTKVLDNKLSRGGSGTIRRTLNTFVYGNRRSAPDPLTSESPYGGSDIAIRTVPPARQALDDSLDQDREMGKGVDESTEHYHEVK